MKTEVINEYEAQANKFMEDTQTTMTVKYLENGLYFDGDKDKRDIYEITLTKGGRSYTFKFGQSIIHSGDYIVTSNYSNLKEIEVKRGQHITEAEYKKLRFHDIDFKRNHQKAAPTAYDVLACLEKYGVGDIDEFCDEFGYGPFASIKEMRRIEKVYKAVCDEYWNLQALYSEAEMEALREIS